MFVNTKSWANVNHTNATSTDNLFDDDTTHHDIPSPTDW